jgi:hypothetical protein
MIKNALFVFIVLGLTALHASAQDSKPEQGDRHEFVRKGDQPKDMKMGNYVVVARTLSEADAIKFIADIKKLEIPVPAYGYQSNQSFWLIYFDVNDDIEQASQKRNEYKKHDLYKSAYLLTIHQ